MMFISLDFVQKKHHAPKKLYATAEQLTHLFQLKQTTLY